MNLPADVAPRRILIADDEPAIIALMAEILTWSGFQVLRARGGVEALMIARAERPDLVMLDVMMPDLDGRDACRALKMDTDMAAVPVVLFSSADESAVGWRAARADAFLQKPFRMTALPALVRQVLDAPSSLANHLNGDEHTT